MVSLAYINAFAQPVIKNQRGYGGGDDEYLLSMYLTTDGGLIAGSFSFSNKSGTKTEDSRGWSDYWVVKLSNTGKVEWDKTIGGSDADELYAIQQTSDGGYILGGLSWSNISGEKTENSRGLADYWIVKINSTGKIEWDKTIGGGDYDDCRSLQQTTDGGYILGGLSASNVSGEKTDNSRGVDDYWVVKLNSAGNVEWDKTIGGSNYDGIMSLQQTREGGYILGGFSYSNSSGEKTEDSRGNRDFWIVKLDNSGNIEWDKTVGGNDDDRLQSIQQTTDGGYIFGGSSRSNKSGEKTENSRGFYDYWIVKLDSFHNIQSDKTIGGNFDDYLQSIQQTTDDGYIVGGNSISDISGEKTEDSREFSTDYWAVKIKSNGKIQWDKTIGGNSLDHLSGIVELSKDRYVLGGYSYSGISGDKTQELIGECDCSDFWLVGLLNKIGSLEVVETTQAISGIRPNTNKAENFIVYPNPAKNSITVNYTAQQNGKYLFEVTGINGNVLLRQEANAIVGANSITMDISRLFKGVYFITISKPGNIKERIQLNKE